VIGWYVHDHGSGHRRRLEAVAAHLDVPVTGMGSGPPAAGVEWLALPTDASHPPGSEPLDPTAGGTLHWAPVGEPGLAGRAEVLARWVRESGCRVLVVDVSVEMLLLGRLLGLATVAVLQPGDRDDRAHRLGYDTAAALLAPFPRPSSWLLRLPGRAAGGPAARTTWTGGFSVDDGRPAALRPPECVGRRCVALVLGRGGHQVTAPDVRAASAATPGWHWHVAGRLVGDERVGAADVSEHGPLPDAWELLSRVDVVVGPSGGGLVADVAAAGVPMLALPQPRPFDEQAALAEMLRRTGCAEVAGTWPAPREWAGLLDRLGARGRQAPRRWERWSDGYGAIRAARLVEHVHRAAGRETEAPTRASGVDATGDVTGVSP
jgi:hypothetical protein